ncbi:3-oxoacyl-[acyl-carrier-protein] reductase [Oenococcus oeni]|uniref:SDR family oxidoreductase n=1 Tax=Oenococcus oeni TaxID=1247 RepID=UPI00107C1377|nr:SDR family oxidoreductase [Oenococcus oeni]MDN6968121.1 SDR family oxidoreductase [Oenococcus sp. UCMA 17063]AVI94407.1 3-ketoacyl-ACP reductase [Oenococcus oeni]SYW02833.1 3-oxoacyl-(acyl-carrier-protein) reductase [Oenococcus oeni]SYW03623.1 3-oxoacyl-(acyl-carrier-protein) reductase [Oenococcus oeni]SYW19185.1 3-oxoacyl-(acyl-carrier-protein) reductase [Oenococcus oeni]
MTKTAIVTGASRGIGREIALKLAQTGFNVVVNYNSNSDSANEVVKEIEKLGQKALAVQANVGNVADTAKLFDQAIEKFGEVNVLVNNAGLMITQPINEVTEEIFDRQFQVNVKGTYFMLQNAFNKLANNGAIVNISTSVNGQMFPTYSVYAGTKGAVEQFTRQLAKEFGPKQININAIAPGPTGTDLFLNGKSQTQIDQLASLNAFNRLGKPDDIAEVVNWLVSPEAKWVNGQTLRVNGGFI